ncbi:putative reverse transcriptase, RNA-dependent DNA polymerase [Tanacetum coccineum]
MSNALADLGASISVMPYSLFKRLGLGSLKPIKMTIEIADRSMQSPNEIKENVLVKISNFVFPVDFIIFDIRKDKNVLIILGRPMLATTHAKIDVLAEIKEDFSMTLYDPDKRMSLGLEEFVDIDDMWDDLDPGILTNEKAKIEFLKSGESRRYEAIIETSLTHNHVGIKSLREDEDNLKDFRLISNIKAMLMEFLVLILLFPFYCISLMYNRDIVQIKWGDGSRINT